MSKVYAYGGPFVCKFLYHNGSRFFVHICFVTVHSFSCGKLKKVEYQVSGSEKTLNDDQALTASVHHRIFDIERTNRFFLMKNCVFSFVFYLSRNLKVLNTGVCCKISKIISLLFSVAKGCERVTLCCERRSDDRKKSENACTRLFSDYSVRLLPSVLRILFPPFFCSKFYCTQIN